ncbi:MAG: M10 family metallopeptidase C-terminal domain-containing protein [Microcystis sp. M061S2]|nr:M10 family metallopeptidase C-terminal domain-containing protein [Microcystis sp. M061S2]
MLTLIDINFRNMPQTYIDIFSVNSFTALAVDNWTILGLTGNDTLTGNSLADIIEGGVGNDRLFGLGGNDILNGGDGDDFLDGGIGDDYLSGEIGNDTLFGSLGSDFFNGGTGTDVANYSSFGSSITLLPTGSVLKGGGATDQLFQVETIIANAGFSNNIIDASGAASPASINVNLGLSTNNLRVVGGPVLTFTATNFDDVIGTNQSDTITGDLQANILSGNAGNDTINGGLGGNDILTGGFGNDTLNGGSGIDTLTGNADADIFVFQVGQSTISNPDRITDFAFGTDRIGLSFLPSSFTRANNSTATTTTALATQVFTDANGLSANNQPLLANSAALVQVTSIPIAGTYLLINDSNPSLSLTDDLLVNITGSSGTLPGFGNITPVSSFFTVA